MIALLALCTHLCPNHSLEESITKVIREKHGTQLSKEAYTELFVFCSPKFISPFLPDFSKSSPFPIENAHKHQVRLLDQHELAPQATFRELRSYLKLYTSISVAKLVSFGNDPLSLLSLKLHSRQLESNQDPVDSNIQETAYVPSFKNASYKSALDIHYYLSDDDTVHVDAAEKQRRFENYFLGQIVQSYEIRKEANSIDLVE